LPIFEVCQQCGEAWISHEIAKRLERLLQEMKMALAQTTGQKLTAVEVVDFKEAA